MRYIVTKGTPLTKYFCPACGQVELLTEDEKPECQNCGTKLATVIYRIKDLPDTQDPEPVKEEDRGESGATPGPERGPAGVEEKPPRVHKGGRPRKVGRPPKQKETCSTCAHAMNAETGYTCKIDITSKRSDDSCGLYLEGTPID